MVRVRYAPSPTGSPHVGNIRTALFNFLLARKEGGQFIVRIEDTDRARAVEGALEDILESLRWLGIEWDEGPEVGGPHAPYFQSERLASYREIADELIASGKAYRCFCTPEELEKMREFQRINKLPTGYNRRCRERDASEVESLIAAGTPHVVRLAMPLEGKIAFSDSIRGRVEYDASLIDDQVLLKADGWPTYHLANVVDDHREEITHVIRGEEWISSTPKHVVLYDALGWTPPIFVHVPVIKGPDGSKLSKRHGDTRCLDYREKGYLGSAVANYIALIGWSPGGDREVMTMNEMQDAFSLEGLQPSPGVFDITKLQWMNGVHLRNLSPDELYDAVKSFHETSQDEEYKKKLCHRSFSQGLQDREYATQALVLEQERVKLLADFCEACEFFFVNDVTIDPDAAAKWFGHAHTKPLYEFLLDEMKGRSTMSVEECDALICRAVQHLGLEKRALAIHPTRVALTGKTHGPGLFELMSLLGPARMGPRLAKAVELAELH